MIVNQPESMNRIIGDVLRFGVLLAAVVITAGTLLLAASTGSTDAGASLTYSSDQIPHGSFDPSLTEVVGGVEALNPYSVIELGVLLLLATPVTRVGFSVYLFAAAGDRAFLYITITVLLLLIFSMLVTPFIPRFNG